MEDPNKERGELCIARLMGKTKARKHYICPELKKKKKSTNKKNNKAKIAKLEKAGAQKTVLEEKNKHMQVEIRAQGKEIREFKVKEADKEADLRKNASREEDEIKEANKEGEKKPSKKEGPKKKKKGQKNASKEEEKVWDPLALWWEGEEAAGG
jgi:hypothetical protein